MGIVVLVADDVDAQRQTNLAKFLGVQRDIYDALAVLLNLPALLIHVVFRQNLALLALRKHLELGLQAAVVGQSYLLHRGVSQKDSLELDFLLWLDFHERHLTFCVDRQTVHVLANPVNVDHHNHVVLPGHQRDENYLDV